MTLSLLPLISVAIAATQPAVVRVGSVELDAQELAARAADLRAASPRISPEQILDGIVGDLVLAEQARRTKLDAKPAVRAAIESQKARALASYLTDTTLANGVSVTDAEILRLYHQGNDTARLTLVVVADAGQAAEVRKRLDQGGEWTLEASRSLDPASARRRGDTGPMSRMQMDEALAAAVFAAPVGGTVGPVKLKVGFAIARVDERTSANEADLPRYRDQIVAYARRTAVARARAHLLERRRKEAAVTIDDPFVASLKLPIDERSGELDRPVATIGKSKILLRDVLPALRAAQLGGHGATLVITRAVHSVVDEFLLAQEAERVGLDKTAAGVAELARAEVRALSRAQGEAIISRLPRKATREQQMAALGRRVAELRKELGAWVDQKKALEAVSGRN